MILKIVFIVILILTFIIYQLYLKNYFKVKKAFDTLSNFLNVRDSLVLKLICEIKDKKLVEKIVGLIDERKENFKTSYNNSIKADVKLNSELKSFYEALNNIKKNDVINSVFGKVINLEKDLKKIRNEYNEQVEIYNNNLIRHKFVCLRVIKMKPLDTYGIKK